ncbi:MAG: hypothetical protein ABIL05_02990 [candidate division WOR-3 bacterium]
MEYIVQPYQIGTKCNHPPIGCPLDICVIDGCGIRGCMVQGCGVDNCGVDGCGSQCSGRGGGCSCYGYCAADCHPGVN